MSQETYPAVPPMPAEPQQPPRSTGNGFGIAALVLGIVTMVGFAIPFLNFATIATGVAGVVLGIIGLVVKFKPRKAAIAGVILSGLGLVLSIILVVIYAAAFNGAAKALEQDTMPSATPNSSSAANSGSAGGGSSTAESFKNNVLTTADVKIVITSHKVIAVGQPGNEYGTKPVIAFYYTVTNVSGKRIDPNLAFIGDFTAIQDNNPNAENTLNVGSLPDEKFVDSQNQDIKKGGTVENAVSYELTDSTTPVQLVASDDLGITKLGTATYPVK